jgi:hypothetical protein
MVSAGGRAAGPACTRRPCAGQGRGGRRGHGGCRRAHGFARLGTTASGATGVAVRHGRCRDRRRSRGRPDGCDGGDRSRVSGKRASRIPSGCPRAPRRPPRGDRRRRERHRTPRARRPSCRIVDISAARCSRGSGSGSRVPWGRTSRGCETRSSAIPLRRFRARFVSPIGRIARTFVSARRRKTAPAPAPHHAPPLSSVMPVTGPRRRPRPPAVAGRVGESPPDLGASTAVGPGNGRRERCR